MLDSDRSFCIAQIPVGPQHPVLVIAEIAQAHDGSLGTAHAYIDAVARTGAQAIKFQTHIAAAESSPDEPWRVKFSRQDDSRYAYWRRMEFTPTQWRELKVHAHDVGLVFLSTPFSLAALEMLAELDLPAWKVGSGDSTNLPMLEAMARTGKPVLLSSGMASWSDLDRAVEVLHAASAYAIMQCTSQYPTTPEYAGLNVIGELRRRYSCTVGYSDHSGEIHAGLAAIALGADLVEVHTVFSRACFGPDTTSSLVLDDLARLVDGARFIRTALQHPLDKDRMADELGELRYMFGKSLVAARDIASGSVLTANDVLLKKPASGIAAAELTHYLGRTLARTVEANRVFCEEDFQ